MSQEKVNRYKAEKANRKEILKKEKRNRILVKAVMILITIAIIGWIGFSIYDYSVRQEAKKSTEVDLAPVNDYLQGLNTQNEDVDTGKDQDTQDSAADGDEQSDQEENSSDKNTDEAEEDTADKPADENGQAEGTNTENNN